MSILNDFLTGKFLARWLTERDVTTPTKQDYRECLENYNIIQKRSHHIGTSHDHGLITDAEYNQLETRILNMKG